jgi:HSP20 family protein
MFKPKSTGLVRRGDWLDPFAALSRIAPEFKEFLGEVGWPAFPAGTFGTPGSWSPNIDVFERDNRLIAKIDLPGARKEEVKVEVADGWLTIFGERKRETESENENMYRREREYGTFSRALPLPEGAKVGEVKAFFENGVLEVTVPLAARPAVTRRNVTIEEPTAAAAKTKVA